MKSLAAQTLLDVSSEEATKVLFFSSGRLSIVKPFVLRSSQRGILQDFVGAVVAEAFTSDVEFCLSSEGGDQIAISLRDEDFTRPEAAVYVPKNGPIVVFK